MHAYRSSGWIFSGGAVYDVAVAPFCSIASTSPSARDNLVILPAKGGRDQLIGRNFAAPEGFARPYGSITQDWREEYLMSGPRRLRRVAFLAAAFALFSLAGVALAKSFTLQVAKGKVTNQTDHTKNEQIVVWSENQHAVYYLTGDSKKNSLCFASCLNLWPPVKSKNTTKAVGIMGKLGTWHRNGFYQVTLNGHPLYTFAYDYNTDWATAEGVSPAPGQVWHAVLPRTF
jgi:predicted lipoprotein with Yx(FWY)xxD motif